MGSTTMITLIENKITVKRNELIVTRTELERFEKTHGEVIQLDKYLSGGPGRPTAMHFVMEEFRRRAKAGECLSKLSSEAKALLK